MEANERMRQVARAHVWYETGMGQRTMGDRGSRRYAVGAELTADGASFRLWAPKRKQVKLVVQGAAQGAARELAMSAEGGGYFSITVASDDVTRVGAGTRYRYRLDNDSKLYPDPASRFQPEGPHGPSMVIDSLAMRLRHKSPDIAQGGHVMYEMHVGTFTPEGTWSSAIAALPELAALGITLIELMPVAEFPGKFGWGYDGVNLFAPCHLYGTPDHLRRFVDEAHGLGLGVILDVVYNHLGPDGNYLANFADEYFTDRYETEWGKAIHFDGSGSGPVREFFATNAVHWIEEYRFDGLRFDATQAIFDTSDEHILTRITREVRAAAAATGRTLFLVAENEPQEATLVRSPEKKGHGLDALWNDDGHHAAVVALTGRREAYYSDYRGEPRELLAAARWGYLYQGQRYAWQKKRRGSFALDLTPNQFVMFLENHDQVANSGTGMRLRSMAQPAAYRAMVALLLLGPWTPMLFQGEEWGSQSPFFYFADHEPDLARLVRVGRAEFLTQFPSLSTEAARASLSDPGSKETFESSKLNRETADPHVRALYRDLLRLRREDPVISAAVRAGERPEGAIFGARALVLRYASRGREGDRLVVLNLGADETFECVSEPLLATDQSERWRVLWTSENTRYGGRGIGPLDLGDRFTLPASCALLFGSERAVPEPRASSPSLHPPPSSRGKA